MASGGVRANSGRKSKAQEIKEIEELNLLLPQAVKTVRLCMRGKNKQLAFYAAKLVIDKCIPESLNLGGQVNVIWLEQSSSPIPLETGRNSSTIPSSDG